MNYPATTRLSQRLMNSKTASWATERELYVSLEAL